LSDTLFARAEGREPIATYNTNLSRLSIGVLAGLLVEALMLMPVATIVYWGPDEGHLPIRWNFPALVGIVNCAVRLDAALVAAFVLGGIVWGLLHRAGRSSWPYAAFLGFAASFLCMYSLSAARALEEHAGANSFAILAIFGAFYGLVGGVAWLIAWRIAYGKSKKRQLAVKHTG